MQASQIGPTKYERSLVAFVDFLGFSEASKELADEDRENVLALLVSLAQLRSEFDAAITGHGGDTGTSYSIKPAVSTFSDHIVISFPMESLAESMKTGGSDFFAQTQIQRLISAIAASALRLGYLLRGAATVGKLYHGNGVVFGEALVEVVELEARTAVYPRVIISSKFTRDLNWQSNLFARKDDDGIFYIDYIKLLPLHAAVSGDQWAADVKNWFSDVNTVITRKLDDLNRAGKLNELSKWTWFAKRFRTALSEFQPEMNRAMGIDLKELSWGK